MYVGTYTRIIYYNFEKKLSDLFCRGPSHYIPRESDNGGAAAAVLPVSALHNTYITGFSSKIYERGNRF